jgi:hypothetical protein
VISEYSVIRCKFSDGKRDFIVNGDLVTYPFHSKGYPNSVSCVTPPWMNAGTVSVSFSINGRDFSKGYDFTYYEKLKESSIHPKCGPNKGETRVTIKGSGFEHIANMYIKWGLENRPVKQNFNPKNDTIVGFSAPTPTTNTHGGFVYVEIGMNNEFEEITSQKYTFYGDYTNDKMLYLYYKEPVIKYIYPHGGPNIGGTEVEVAGAWYINYPSMGATPRAKFGNVVVDCKFYNTVRVFCVSPPRPNFTGKVPFELSFNG